MFDDPFQEQVRAEAAQQQRALRGAGEIAQLLCSFRAQLILGGFPPEDATDMAREYYEHLLGIREALPEDFEEEDD